MTTSRETNLLGLTADIVAAHAASNQMPHDQLPKLIRSVYAALDKSSIEVSQPALEPQEPAVPIKKSVFPDYIICLEDGKKLKMLKRHLSTAYDMTVDAYRAKWDLPPSYPMVAPNYAHVRSVLAKKIGLGRRQEEAPVEPSVMQVPEGVSGRGRRRKKAA
jgi:predicted transcriptional regulator